ncbi:hypothetical protein GWK47_040130 [Chionoecetes opilio]|uniref:PiggyBac transposable element-derived protein 4 C-terminal zinc-ribbon domain-containing protein n=1 Tax=Chionoecetes opilio TaxID=41210 RepID=A0A8J4YJN6_CHIOP|nr:hypothetical protein GWK47_040130 [Chionoecetes opilio]
MEIIKEEVVEVEEEEVQVLVSVQVEDDALSAPTRSGMLQPPDRPSERQSERHFLYARDPPERLAGSRVMHTIEKIGNFGVRRRCRVCSRSGQRRESTFQCAVCKVPLCVKKRYKILTCIALRKEGPPTTPTLTPERYKILTCIALRKEDKPTGTFARLVADHLGAAGGAQRPAGQGRSPGTSRSPGQGISPRLMRSPASPGAMRAKAVTPHLPQSKPPILRSFTYDSGVVRSPSPSLSTSLSPSLIPCLTPSPLSTITTPRNAVVGYYIKEHVLLCSTASQKKAAAAAASSAMLGDGGVKGEEVGDGGGGEDQPTNLVLRRAASPT